ncbi:MAG TPA: formate--tetrahydrofolate ligase [Bryobacteraceae bacterium]|nr:formate--tetrahydrofolate ligase [Bryobacteraceae bacterium]HPT27873.1 formate--tetrahydrofolate ligase [Bryobacteraceae bacterium]
MRLIREIADKLEIPDEYMEYYGRYTAKLRLELLARPQRKGRLILVTAITPTSHGEGKTVVSIGLTQALARLGKRTVVTLREPSLGPVFGIKGGATGGGLSQVLPSDIINLHFNGDIHAVTAAHNLLAAMIDAHLHHGNALRIDVDNIIWPRALDMNDRALRHVIVGLGGKAHGVPRETEFVITAASEVMAILALASDREDLRRRLNGIVAGFDLDNRAVRASDVRATGGMMVLLNEALMPNLVQTTEGAPAFVHAGPFANIAHGTASVISQRMALGLADYVVNETGFGADLGAEKYFDLVMPASGLRPSLAVLIASAKAICAQGAASESGPFTVETLRAGFPNLDRHISNLRKFGVPVLVAVNRFPGDADELIAVIGRHCAEMGVESAPCDVFTKGGEGGLELAEKAVTLASGESDPKPIYDSSLDLQQKTRVIAHEIYGAADVYFETEARKALTRFTDAGFGRLPVCVAKTQSSITDRAKIYGAPEGWTMTVSGAHLSAGAGFVVVTAGNMMRMPGLGKSPQAFLMDVDEGGVISGLR